MIEKVIGIGVTIFMLTCLAVLGWAIKVELSHSVWCNKVNATVVSIGTCSKGGLCSVRLSDNSVALVYLPVVGLNNNVCVIRD